MKRGKEDFLRDTYLRMTLCGCNHVDDFLVSRSVLYIVLMFKVFLLIQKNVYVECLFEPYRYILCWMGNIMVVNSLKTMQSTVFIYMKCLHMHRLP